jgi:hypothetical protein
MLAPINQPTGDGRRFAKGALTHRPLPLGLKWQRADEGGHDSSVIIGLMDTLTIDEEAGEVWAEGELFDDQGDTLPRLAEDVAEAMLLTSRKVIGPSVDAGAASAILVETGSDEPVSEERMEELFWESVESGTDPDVELLFKSYEIAAATLVSIPAFAEARPFDLIDVPTVEDDEDDEEQVPARTDAALVASLTAAAAVDLYPVDAFALPTTVDQIMPIQVEDRGEGFTRVYGYVAAHGTCHVQFRDMCVTPPTSGTDYAVFHRYPIQVEGELLGVGRLTTGHGRVGTGCACCPGKDDHACDGADLAATLAHYDRLTTLAYVRAGEDDRGIWVAGVAAPGLTAADLQVLEGQKFSGDWRAHGGNLELVEVLALAAGRVGFPLPATAMRNGRQVSLTAAGGIPPRPAAASGGLPSPLEGAFGRLRAVLDEALAPYGQQLAELSGRLAGAGVLSVPDGVEFPRGDDDPANADAGDDDPADGAPDQTVGEQAADLTAQIDAALAADAYDRRTRQAAALIAELEEVAP